MTCRAIAAALFAAAAFGCGPTGGGGPVRDSGASVGAVVKPAGPPKESAGRAVFDRENCARCHTLLEAPRGGDPEHLPAPAPPAAIPSRVGPDLGIEGHRRSDDWQFAHLYAPDVLSPGSPMPASRHLFRTATGGLPEPTGEARALVAWLQTLGRDERDVWAEFRSREPAIPAPVPVADEAAARERLALGEGLYARHCVVCHGEAGDGRGPAAPLLERPPRDFVTGAYRFRSNDPSDPPLDADLFRAITLGTGTGAAMPAFYFLTPGERWALVARLKEFSAALRGRPLDPRPVAGHTGADAGSDAAAPSPEAGRALWGSLGCARCHGDDAGGRMAGASGMDWGVADGRPVASSGDLRHACARRGGASDEAFDRALRHGVGGAMPSFAAALVGRPDAARALRAFVESLQGDAAAPAGPH